MIYNLTYWVSYFKFKSWAIPGNLPSTIKNTKFGKFLQYNLLWISNAKKLYTICSRIFSRYPTIFRILKNQPDIRYFSDIRSIPKNYLLLWHGRCMEWNFFSRLKDLAICRPIIIKLWFLFVSTGFGWVPIVLEIWLLLVWRSVMMVCNTVKLNIVLKRDFVIYIYQRNRESKLTLWLLNYALRTFNQFVYPAQERNQ